jgi:hypothetical protein
MNEEHPDLEVLKKNPQLHQNLKRLEEEIKTKRSISRGYWLLEAEEEEISTLFTFIVDEAFDRLANILVSGRKFDMDDPKQWATVRALYEHAIQRYSGEDTKRASEIFLLLSHSVADEELRDAMMIHAAAIMAGYDFDAFIENLADIKTVDPNDASAFFITGFVRSRQTILEKFSKEVEKGMALLGRMETNRGKNQKLQTKK